MITIESPLLQKHDHIQHGFFGRTGGVSEGIFDSLNCGLGSNDDPAHVLENRRHVASHFHQPPSHLIGLRQTHSNISHIVTTPWSNDTRPEGDSMVTDQPNLVLGIVTADCGPILFYGQKEDSSPVIGAAHAGWGGALRGINERTIDQMLALGATLETIKISIGPCIGPQSYEVSDDFITPFLDQDPDNDHFFKATNKQGKLMFDLPGYIARRLSLRGIRQIDITGIDTYSDETRFFSYRRTTHRQETDYGRQLSCIMIKDSNA